MNRRSVRRRLCSGVTLLAYLVAAIGFPVPQTAVRSSHTCGQSVCCCGSAEQCKASGCGCAHSPAPAEETPAEDEESVPSCCVKKPTKTTNKTKNNTVRWVAGLSAQKCRGGPTQWLSAENGLPTADWITWQPSWPYCHSLPILHERSFVIAKDPVDPPPRLEAV